MRLRAADLMSYLLFTPKYTQDLIDIGYHDADERIDEIEDFLYSSDNDEAESTKPSRWRGQVARSYALSRNPTQPGQVPLVILHR